MSMAISIRPVRASDDEANSEVSFDCWEGLNEYERISASMFAEGIEYSFEDNPPTLFIDYDPQARDLILGVWLTALNNGDSGPLWNFSMKDALSRVPLDNDPEDVRTFIKIMREIASEIESRLTE